MQKAPRSRQNLVLCALWDWCRCRVPLQGCRCRSLQLVECCCQSAVCPLQLACWPRCRVRVQGTTVKGLPASSELWCCYKVLVSECCVCYEAWVLMSLQRQAARCLWQCGRRALMEIAFMPQQKGTCLLATPKKYLWLFGDYAGVCSRNFAILMGPSSGYSLARILPTSSSKSAPNASVLWHFEMQTELSLQSGAYFADLIFQTR